MYICWLSERTLLRTLFYSLLLLLSTKASCQVIYGQVIDSSSNLPLGYVNIGVVGKNVGTVSDSKGNFELVLDGTLPSDTLRFSMINYFSKDFLIIDFLASVNVQTIGLSERTLELEEVVVTSKPYNPRVLGILRKSCYPIPIYRGASSNLGLPSNELGQEIGTLFSIGGEVIQLDSVRLNFAKCIYDSVTFRLNIYSVDKENKTNILKEPLYVSLTREEMLQFPVIDLSALDLIIDADFLITVENIKNVAGLGVYFYANFKSQAKSYPTFYKRSSHSSWAPILKNSKPVGISILSFVH